MDESVSESMNAFSKEIPKRALQRLCVFCGSSIGKRDAFQRAARELGSVLATHSIELIYGGGNCGLMGVLADQVLQSGGRVTGVIPEGLMTRELGHLQLTKLHVVAGMHERKALMASLADGFIALPGGFGTLEELFEVITWGQLGLQQKPIGLVNVEGFFDPIFELMDHAIREGFVRPEQRHALVSSPSPSELLERIRGGGPESARISQPSSCEGRSHHANFWILPIVPIDFQVPDASNHQGSAIWLVSLR